VRVDEHVARGVGGAAQRDTAEQRGRADEDVGLLVEAGGVDRLEEPLA
jgi:hypothetical protein